VLWCGVSTPFPSANSDDANHIGDVKHRIVPDERAASARKKPSNDPTIPLKFLKNIDIDAISEDLTLTNPIKELFELSALEIEKLEASLSTALTELVSLDQLYLDVTNSESEKVEFLIHPYPKEGGEIQSRLAKQVVETLGETRGEYFVDRMSRVTNTQFAEFGQRRRKGVIRRLTEGDDSPYAYEIKFEFFYPASKFPNNNPEDVEGTSLGRTTLRFDELPNHLSHLFEEQ
jgi:hypothetical protein